MYLWFKYLHGLLKEDGQLKEDLHGLQKEHGLLKEDKPHVTKQRENQKG